MRPIICIMPTCNRPRFARFAVDQFLRQDYPNKSLVVINSGQEKVLLASLGHMAEIHCPSNGTGMGSLTKNIRLGVSEIAAYYHSAAEEIPKDILIAIWEDDDWYRHDRLSFQAREIGDAPAHGIPWTLYYHIGIRKWLRMEHPRRSSNFLTMARLDWLLEHPYPEAPSDMRLWDAALKDGGKLSEPDVLMGVGIKHGFGECLGDGHDPKFYSRCDAIGDDKLLMLSGIVRGDALAFYMEQAELKQP